MDEQTKAIWSFSGLVLGRERVRVRTRMSESVLGVCVRESVGEHRYE